MGSLGDGRDPERPVRDQALTTVDVRIDRELDTAERLLLVRQAQAIIEQDPPLLPVACERINPKSTAVTAVEEVSHSPLGAFPHQLTDQSKMQVWVCRTGPLRGNLRGPHPHRHVAAGSRARSMAKVGFRRLSRHFRPARSRRHPSAAGTARHRQQSADSCHRDTTG